MEESLTRHMRERGLNRSSVIRLALYALDCISRRREVGRLSLAELVALLEELAPEARVSFAEFICGTQRSPKDQEPARASACAEWSFPAFEQEARPR